MSKKCEKKHKYKDKKEFTSIPKHQGKKGRHKCAGCAYELGYGDGKEKKPPCLEIDSIEYNSQASVQRHRSVECAYALGYIHGFSDSQKI